MQKWFNAPRAYLILFFITLAFRVATALPVERAGYMDASYSVHVGANLARGRGFTEDVLWNYLDAPTALPHPSNLYWMPLPAILAAGAFLLFGISFHAAQIPFILLAVVPPLFAFYLARRIYARDDYAWMAGLLTVFSGFYTIYWVSPDNFTPFAITADLALLFIAFAMQAPLSSPRNFFIAGIFVGLSQLSRADGFILVAVIPLAIIWSRREWSALRSALGATLIAALGFLLVMLPWFVRDYLAVGNVLAPGGARTLFLTGYNELFRYHVEDLTPAHYLAWGLANIVSSKLAAFGFSLLVLLFGALLLYLAPLAAWGLWRLRARVEFKPLLIYALLLVLAMALVFTFPAQKGSLLHSSAALVPYFAVAVPAGLDAAIGWMARHRRTWDARSARIFFGTGFVALACIVSVLFYASGIFDIFSNLFGGSKAQLFCDSGVARVALWNARDTEFATIGKVLDARGVSPLQPVLTVDPPSFYNESGRRSIYLPTESIDALFDAAHQFDAHYLVLQVTHPPVLNDLYCHDARIDGLVPVTRLQDALGEPVTLFEITR